MEPEAFWRQTPRTFVAIMKGRAAAAEQRHNEAMSTAWHVEAFARSKRLPKLKAILIARDTSTGPQRQPPDALLGAMRAWASVTKH